MVPAPSGQTRGDWWVGAAGAVVGTVLNKLLVPWIITVLLVIVLGLTTFNTLRKVIHLG